MTPTPNPDTKIYPVVLSGGAGTRLWPVSRSLYPKQLLALAGEATMLQATVSRFFPVEAEPPMVVCNDEHRFIIAEQLREIGVEHPRIVLEPVGRNTAPAAAVAALLTHQADPDAVVVLLPADHVVRDEDAFRTALTRAVQAAEAGHLVTFGVTPTEPHTGYGYIRRGDPAVGEGIFSVCRFVEKPDRQTAEAYLVDGGYSWNSGIFVFRAAALIDEMEHHAPAILAACRLAVTAGQDDLDFFRLDHDTFAACPADSIDYAVMEKTADAVVVPVEMGWSDVGSWSALWEIGEADADGNVAIGDVMMQDTRNSYVRSERALIATVGLEDVVVVETADAVLVADRGRVQDVKAIVDGLKAEGRDLHESHTRCFRPWGYYETVNRGARYQVKHICVTPGAALSLQLHHHRAEHWVVVSGTARITRGDDLLLLSENESVYIPIGMAHRLENPGLVPLHLIEVQSGAYLGEDDIVRLEDVYNRTSAAAE